MAFFGRGGFRKERKVKKGRHTKAGLRYLALFMAVLLTVTMIPANALQAQEISGETVDVQDADVSAEETVEAYTDDAGDSTSVSDDELATGSDDTDSASDETSVSQDDADAVVDTEVESEADVQDAINNAQNDEESQSNTEVQDDETAQDATEPEDAADVQSEDETVEVIQEDLADGTYTVTLNANGGKFPDDAKYAGTLSGDNKTLKIIR